MYNKEHEDFMRYYAFQAAAALKPRAEIKELIEDASRIAQFILNHPSGDLVDIKNL